MDRWVVSEREGAHHRYPVVSSPLHDLRSEFGTDTHALPGIHNNYRKLGNPGPLLVEDVPANADHRSVASVHGHHGFMRDMVDRRQPIEFPRRQLSLDEEKPSIARPWAEFRKQASQRISIVRSDGTRLDR